MPASIERPEYAWKDEVQENVGEPFVQTPETIEAMREASKIAANALALGGAAVAPGTTTDEIDGIVHDYLVEHGAYPSTLGYRGYPKSCCISLNEIVCHGIPDTTVIQDGDIVNIDVTAYKNGVHGDTNATFLAGDVAEEHRLLVQRTYEATMRGIKAAKPGREINVIGRVIEAIHAHLGWETPQISDVIPEEAWTRITRWDKHRVLALNPTHNVIRALIQHSHTPPLALTARRWDMTCGLISEGDTVSTVQLTAGSVNT